jgi:hypothetical protein
VRDSSEPKPLGIGDVVVPPGVTSDLPDEKTKEEELKHARLRSDLNPTARLIYEHEQQLGLLRDLYEQRDNDLRLANKGLDELRPKYAAAEVELRHARSFSGLSVVSNVLGGLLLGMAAFVDPQKHGWWEGAMLGGGFSFMLVAVILAGCEWWSRPR